MTTKINKSENQRNQDFEVRYKEFFVELTGMPKETVEDKEKRYQWFRTHELHDEIIINLMEAIRPRAYEKFRKRISLDDNGEMYKDLSSDFDIASFKHTKELDPVVYMETVIESIKTYTGVNSKKEQVPFITYVRKKYKQNAEKASGINMEAETNYGLTMPETQDRNKVYIVKLIRSLNDLKERVGNQCSIEQLVSMAIENSGTNHEFTKNEIDTAIIKVFALDIRHLDSDIDEDGNRMEEIIGEAEKEFERIDNNGILSKFIQRLAENPERFWKELSIATNKKSREWIKVFLTKDILIALKLDNVPLNYLKGELPKKIKDNLEPNCGQWCTSKKYCNFSSVGCSIRYDKIKSNPPFGNEEVYRLLATEKDLIYKNLLHKKYLDGALLNENLMDVWNNKLYCNPKDKMNNIEQYFDFLDETIGRILGIEKSTISHARKNYEKAKVIMYKFFLEM